MREKQSRCRVTVACRAGLFAARNSSDRAALAWLLVLSAVASLVVVAIGMSSSVSTHQAQVSAATTISSSTHPTGLRAVETDINWKDRFRIRKIVVAATGTTSHSLPPGFAHAPPVGSLWVSPGLLREAARDPDLSAMVPSRAHILRPASVPAPDTMLLYDFERPNVLEAMGVPARVSFGVPVADSGRNLVSVAMVWAAVLLFAVLPCLILLYGAGASLVARRAGRFGALKLLGVTRLSTGATMGIDGLLATLIGSLFGCALAVVLSRVAHSIPGTPASWWPWQANFPYWAAAGALVVTSGTVALAITWSSPRADRDALPPRLPSSLVKLGPAAAGVALLACSTGWKVDGSVKNLTVVTAATVCTVWGVPLAIPVLVRRIGQLIRRGNQPTARLAGARLEHGSAATRRAGTLIAAAVLLGAAITPLVAQAAPKDASTGDVNRQLGRVVVIADGIAPGTSIARVATPSTQVAVGTQAHGQFHLVLPCVSIRRLAGGVATCSSRSQSLSAISDAGWQVEQAIGLPTTVRVGRPNLHIANFKPDQDPLSFQAIAICATPSAAWRAAATLSALPGAAGATVSFGGLIGGPDQPFVAMQRWLRDALGALIVASIVALVLGLAEDGRARRVTDASLVVLGASEQTIMVAHRREVVVRAGAICAVTAVAAFVMFQVAASWTGSDPPPPAWSATLFAGLLVAFVTSVLLAPMMARVHDPLEAVRED